MRAVRLLVAVAGFVAVACGGDDDDAPSPTAASTVTGVAGAREAGAGFTPSPTLTARPSTYEVLPGDTLGEIAERLGVSLEALSAANNLADPDALMPGQVLVIPAAGNSTATPSATTGATASPTAAR